MAKKTDNLRVSALRAEIREPLRLFAEKAVAELGENFKSISVVGSSLTDDFVPGRSDINTVLVLGSYNFNSLKAVAGMAKPMSKKKLSAPLLMTTSYIDRSRDVFGIELLDLQLVHQTILGPDPFEKLTFEKPDVRLQCERELKATLIRLRQGYVAAAANKRLVTDVLVAAAKALVPLLRAILWLKDVDRPRTADAVFAKARNELSVNLDSAAGVRRWPYQKHRPSEDEITAAFEVVYDAVDQLARIVDELEV
jgi:hypothetical protein